MGLFDFLSPGVDRGGQRQQTALLKDAQNETEDAKKDARRDIRRGTSQAQPLLQQGVDLFKGLVDDRQGATDMYMNSLGLNGPEGNQAAIGAYQQSPGYQAALDQANQNVMRTQAQTGALRSGGTGMALADRARDLQNLDYGNWQDRLHGMDVMPAAQGYAGQLNNLGNLFTNQGSQLAGIETGMAPLISKGYSDQAGLLGQQMSFNTAADQQGIGNALGLFGGLTSMFSPAFGKGGMFGA